MIYYVAHLYEGKHENIEKAKKITRDLQLNDLKNAFICPLMAFSHLEYKEIPAEEKNALCIDLLSVSDALIVASEKNIEVQKEIDFARMVGMEVIDLADKYRQI